MSEVSILVNGEPGVQVSVFDRGLMFGDGVFETMAVLAGQPVLWSGHYARMSEGLGRLKVPAVEEALLLDEISMLAKGLPKCLFKVVITRGQGLQGYAPQSPGGAPTRIVIRLPWSEAIEKARGGELQLGICETRLSESATLSGVKHLNRLDQVIAAQEVQEKGFQEGVMLSQEGRVIEGIASNLFFTRGGVLCTPRLDRCGIMGVMRNYILETVAPSLKIPTQIGEYDLEDVLTSDDCFICNSVRGVSHIAVLAGQKFERGPITSAVIHSVEADLFSC